MNAWMLTLAARWHCLAFLLVLLFSASLLGKSVTSALTPIHILISTEDPTSSITENRMLCSFPCKVNCRNNNPFFFVPLEKPFFYLSTPPPNTYTPLAFIDSVTRELLYGFPRWYSSMHFQLPYLVTVFSQTHAHTCGFPFPRSLDSSGDYNYHMVTILTIYTLAYPDHHRTPPFSVPPFLSAALA